MGFEMRSLALSLLAALLAQSLATSTTMAPPRTTSTGGSPPTPTGSSTCGNSCGNMGINVGAGVSYAFASPLFPSNYPNNCQCQWMITAPAGMVVSIRFPIFETEGGYDFLYINDGPNANAPLLEPQCNGDQCFPVYSSGTHMYVQFNSDSSNNFQGFEAIVTAVMATTSSTTTTTTLPPVTCNNCGGNININTTMPGYFNSPGWPNRAYPNGCSCVWHIATGPSTVVSLSWEEPFYVEQGADYINVYDGPSTSSPQIQQCTGNIDACMNVYSSGGYMTVTFNSDGSDTYQGFGAIVVGAQPTTSTTTTTTTTAPLCTQTFTVGPMGVSFTTPNYPNNYPNSVYCQWTFLTSTPGDELILNISSFQTEDCCDHLRVYDGSSTQSTLVEDCHGSYCPKRNFRSSGGSLTVTFQSDDSVNFAGVAASVSLFNPCNCHRTLTLPAGGTKVSFNSPVFPGNYPPSCSCQWTINAPDGQRATLAFNAFNTMAGAEFLKVTDGSATGNLLLQCTGGSCDEISSQTTSTLVVSFTSAANQNGATKLGYSMSAFSSGYICTAAGTHALGPCLAVFELCERANQGVRLAYCPRGTAFKNGACVMNCF